jgi:PhzF family phenazine biosynthesis protein
MDKFKDIKNLPEGLIVDEVSAFTYEGAGGNGAGITLDLNNELSFLQMQEIAAALGYSESAFILRTDKATFKLLFFTPTKRVKMCGHATIAAWSNLFMKGLITSGFYTQEVINENGESQILEIEITESGVVFTNLDLPNESETVNRDELNKYLDYGTSNLPTQIINTGFNDLMIPVSVDTFNNIDYSKVEKEELLEIQKKLGAEGLHMFTITKSEPIEIFAKNTDPINGIYPYDDATGTTNGALLSYLYFNGLVSKQIAEEGVAITQIGTEGKKSKVIVKLKFNDDKISQIQVGGESKIL